MPDTIVCAAVNTKLKSWRWDKHHTKIINTFQLMHALVSKAAIIKCPKPGGLKTTETYCLFSFGG